jgi:hypothetical protein
MNTLETTAFIEPDRYEFSGQKLRPFTASSLILLEMVGNQLLFKKNDEVQDILFHITSFLYIHLGEIDEVRKVALDPASYKNAVLKFGDSLSVQEVTSAGEMIKAMIEKAMAGQNYEVEKEAEGESSPN